MGNWIAVRTQPRRENWAAENVMRQDCEFYLPRYLVYSTRLRQCRSEILFRSYLFAKPENGQWRFLLGTFGVSSVMMRGESPAPVMQQHIDELRKREDRDGFIVLPKRSRFMEGDKVRVTSGPFVTHLGVYQGQTPAQREKVLIDILGGKITTIIDSDALEVA